MYIIQIDSIIVVIIISIFIASMRIIVILIMMIIIIISIHRMKCANMSTLPLRVSTTVQTRLIKVHVYDSVDRCTDTQLIFDVLKLVSFEFSTKSPDKIRYWRRFLASKYPLFMHRRRLIFDVRTVLKERNLVQYVNIYRRLLLMNVLSERQHNEITW